MFAQSQKSCKQTQFSGSRAKSASFLQRLPISNIKEVVGDVYQNSLRGVVRVCTGLQWVLLWKNRAAGETVEVIKDKQEKHLQSEKDIRWEVFFFQLRWCSREQRDRCLKSVWEDATWHVRPDQGHSKKTKTIGHTKFRRKWSAWTWRCFDVSCWTQVTSLVNSFIRGDHRTAKAFETFYSKILERWHEH